MGHDKKKCGSVMMVAWILVIIGALNWGLVGIAGFIPGIDNLNLVNILLGWMPALENIVYVLVGIAALVSLKGCKTCKGGNCAACADGTCATHGDMKKDEMSSGAEMKM